MYALHHKFLFDAQDVNEMECLQIDWTSPYMQFLDVGSEALTILSNQKIRMRPIGLPRCVIHVVADDAYGDYGFIHVASVGPVINELNLSISIIV